MNDETTATGVGGNSRRVIVGVALTAVVVMAVTAILSASEPSPGRLSTAESRVSDVNSFVTGEVAGDALARSAGEVLQEAEQCVADGGPAPRCSSYYAASAWLQVAAVNALTCTAPGRHDARLAAMEVFDLLEGTQRSPGSPRPIDLPPQPCR